MDKIKFYSEQSKFTKLNNDVISTLKQLPSSPDDLFTLVQNLVLHETECQLGNYQFAKKRYNEVYIRDVISMVRKIVELSCEPWCLERNLNQKLISSCRNASLLYVAFLRYKGIPARLKVGFISYHPIAKFNMDHIIVEFYDKDKGAWRWADVLLTDKFKNHNLKDVNLDGTNLQLGQFIPAEIAWTKVRKDSSFESSFGIGLFKSRRGLFTVRNKLLHELAVRLKFEMLPGDLWGYMLFDGPSKDPVDASQLKELDELALQLIDDDLSVLKDKYNRNPALKVPSVVISHSTLSGVSACDWEEVL